MIIVLIRQLQAPESIIRGSFERTIVVLNNDLETLSTGVERKSGKWSGLIRGLERLDQRWLEHFKRTKRFVRFSDKKSFLGLNLVMVE